MNIVYLTDECPPENAGGSGRVAERLAKGIASRGHEVSVVMPTSRPVSWEEDWDGVRFFGLPRTRPAHPFRAGLENRPMLERVIKVLERVKPDVVHAHNLHWQLSYASLEVARSFTDRVFLTAHDLMYVAYGKVFPPHGQCMSKEKAAAFCRSSFLRDLRQAKWAYLPGRIGRICRYLGFVKKIFAASDFIRLALEANGIRRIETQHYGIDPEEFVVQPAALEAFRKKHAINSHQAIFFGGRGGAAKGLEAIFRVIAELVPRHPGIQLLVAVKPGELSEIKKVARALGVENHLRFLGWLDKTELPLAYAACTLVATPSMYFDAFPTVNLEAMAAGRAVVGTCFGGTREAVRDGETGYIVNPYDVRQFAERISALCSDTDLARRMGEAGKRVLRAHLSLDLQLQKTLDAYSS